MQMQMQMMTMRGGYCSRYSLFLERDERTKEEESRLTGVGGCFGLVFDEREGGEEKERLFAVAIVWMWVCNVPVQRGVCLEVRLEKEGEGRERVRVEKVEEKKRRMARRDESGKEVTIFSSSETFSFYWGSFFSLTWLVEKLASTAHDWAETHVVSAAKSAFSEKQRTARTARQLPFSSTSLDNNPARQKERKEGGEEKGVKSVGKKEKEKGNELLRRAGQMEELTKRRVRR